MAASRPARHSRPALTLGQSVVPLTERPDHPAFSSSSVQGPTRASRMTSRRNPAPFPMHILHDPPGSVDHVLPSLAQSDAAFFNDILAKLQGISPPFVASSRTPLPPRTQIVIDVDAHDRPVDLTPSTPIDQLDPASPAVIDSKPTPTVVKSIIFVNLQNQNTDDPGSTFVHIVSLPPNPFASQIVVALNDTCSRFAAATGKWSLSRVLVAYSKKLIEVAEGGYNNGFSGYREVGFYPDVVGRFDETGHGGPKDDTVPQILENREARSFRELYEMPTGTHIFSIYIFHTSGHSLPAPLPRFSTQPPPAGPMPSTGLALQPQPPAATPAIAGSATSMPRPSAPISTYLEQRFPDAILLCRALATSTLGAYKRFAMIRHIRFMAGGLGMVWPETAAHPKPISVTSPTTGSFSITSEALLGITDYPVSSMGTFKNHIAAFRACTKAYDHLRKVKVQGGALTDEQIKAGELFYILLDVEFLDPRVPDFAVPQAYALAVTESIASLTTQASKIAL